MDIKTIVWVRAGGRCVICGKYLLDDDHGQVVAIGEVAHNVGRTLEPRSPRGEQALPMTDRDKPENLLLLCRDDHVRVDNKRLTESRYTVDFLTRLKADHEREVRRLTGLLADRSTVVLRVVGNVRGSIGDVSRQQVDTALASVERFPQYLPDAHYNHLDVDLREVPEDIDGYWETTVAMIDRGVARLTAAVRSGEHAHASVFALARIPLLVHLGAALGDTYPVDVYQRHRTSDSWTWPATAASTGFRTDAVGANANVDQAVIVVNASGVIQPRELPAHVQGLPRYVVRPADLAPSHDVVDSPATLDAFDRTFRSLLTDLEATAKAVKALHLFLATPVSMAVIVGRAVDPQIHPRVHVYDRTADGYVNVLNLPSPHTIEKRYAS